MAADYKVLVVDALGMDPQEIQDALTAITNGLQAAAPHIEVHCTRVTEEYDRSFRTHGSWAAWATHLATGVDYETRTPLFNAVAVLDEKLGKGAAAILEQALDAQRMGVLVREGQLKRVLSVAVVDREDWQSGWRAIYAQ